MVKRNILLNPGPATTTDTVKISILKVGDKFDTQYSVKEIIEG